MKQNVILRQKLTGDYEMMVRNAANEVVLSTPLGTDKEVAVKKLEHIIEIVGGADGFTDKTL